MFTSYFLVCAHSFAHRYVLCLSPVALSYPLSQVFYAVKANIQDNISELKSEIGKSSSKGHCEKVFVTRKPGTLEGQ